MQITFTHPIRQIVMMLIALGAASAVGVLGAPILWSIVSANLYLNGVILAVFAFGVLACFWQVAQLAYSVRWIKTYIDADTDATAQSAPRLLAPLVALLRSRKGKTAQISASSTRSILESVATRIEEARELTRYIVSLLIFLGLLGTFYGLATTVPALVDTISNLAPKDGDGGIEMFTRLMTGLQGQLSGMGVAFASSLLGLAGSLIVGLLELLASHGQNRFYRELEEWLSTITSIGFASTDIDTSGAGAAGMLPAILDNLGTQLAHINDQMTTAAQSQTDLAAQIARLADRLDAPRSTPAGDTDALIAAQRDLLDGLTEAAKNGGLDAESRMRLRSIDVQLLRLGDDIAEARVQMMADLRLELAALTRALQDGAKG
jgi:hypothetical protein